VYHEVPTILQVLPGLTSGGVERGTVEIASAIVKAGWRALVVSSGGPMVDALEQVGAEHLLLPLNRRDPLTLWRNAGRLTQIIRDRRVSLVHARSRGPAWSAYIACNRTQTPFVTTFHGYYKAGNPLKHQYNAVMTYGARVIAISHFIADHILSSYPRTDPAKLCIIHRGVDLERFSVDAVHQGTAHEYARRWGATPDVPLIFCPARFTRWKGQEWALRALAQINEPYLAVFAGSSHGHEGYRMELEQLATDLGIDTTVRFVDAVPDMPAALSLAHVVLAPSLEPEAFGRVPIEAQAMACPVIATDHGGMRETVVPGKTGWLVPPEDTEMLVIALTDALSLHQETRMHIGLEGKLFVAERFALTRMQAETLGVYKEVLG
jgi:glycosyltransferase involved in cell wall biosynthesis